MNREDIDRLAREAGIVDVTSCKWTAHTDDLERFAALVAAAEREACAKVCEEVSKDPWTKVGGKHSPYMEATAKDCAEAIRKRGEVEP